VQQSAEVLPGGERGGHPVACLHPERGEAARADRGGAVQLRMAESPSADEQRGVVGARARCSAKPLIQRNYRTGPR
jgi:hypothetical protein